MHAPTPALPLTKYRAKTRKFGMLDVTAVLEPAHDGVYYAAAEVDAALLRMAAETHDQIEALRAEIQSLREENTELKAKITEKAEVK